MHRSMEEENNNIIESENKVVKKKSKFYFSHIGIVSAILSSIFFSLNALFAKVAAVSPLLITVSRNSLHYMILLPILSRQRDVDDILGPKKYRLYSWIHGFLASVSGMFFYMAIENLSPGNAVTIAFMDVVFVPLLGRIIFKESFTIMDSILAVLAMCGVVLMAKPTFIFQNVEVDKEENPIGILYGLLCAFCSSVSYVLLRKMGKEVHFVNNVFSYVTFGSLVAGVLLAATGDFVQPCQYEVLFIFLVAAASFFGEITLMGALQRERAGTVAVLMTTQIIIVYFIQIIVLHDMPSLLSFLGSGLIFSTSLCIGIRKLHNERQRRKSIAKT